MVYKAKRVSAVASRTYYTILMPDDDGDMVLWDRKNNWGGGYLFTTSLMEAKRFATKEHALNFISEELKGTETSSYIVIPLKVEISIDMQSNNVKLL
ncbi:hypothetical protein JCM21714_3004 [Gracilibacillus boraciitolerans JCM 21714]|uniref:Uncharacterized protein n=1 Tax=Gracilibacillus boraciitolerans JCM 21714 TaxID=1298598 RepID=W4VL57_9BACI|nr:hypothetical protein [Gracilibacillus boraciitolerans]GAE93891.1 hypothetical protein JCM21714_3004 [Gracilibacillus boraciitolerans JCM 21714]